MTVTQDRCNFSAEKFDGAQELGLRRFGHIHLKGNSRDAAQGLTVPQNFFRHFFGVAHQQRAMLAAHGVEVRTSDRRPVAFFR